MKTILITLLLGSSVIFGFGQYHHTPPRQVTESFQKEYPRSQPSHWSFSNNRWSVSFEDNDYNNGEMTAYFDGSGKHIENHIPYDYNDVPASVRNHARDSYGASDSYDYTRIDRYGEKPVYETQVRHKHHSKKTVYIDNDGHERDYHEYHY
ncbi:MAG TPA: hypothetical protein VGG71_03140 [Chitinophagaceae bacterium]|jgi:hypothetical protein